VVSGLQGETIRECDCDGIGVTLFVDDMGMFNDEVAGCTGVSQYIAGVQRDWW
jgi:hypothetical protein